MLKFFRKTSQKLFKVQPSGQMENKVNDSLMSASGEIGPVFFGTASPFRDLIWVGQMIQQYTSVPLGTGYSRKPTLFKIDIPYLRHGISDHISVFYPYIVPTGQHSRFDFIKIKDKILQPFFTTKKGTEGTGLGLSITNDIVKAHGGTIEIHSKPGETIFKILLTV